MAPVLHKLYNELQADQNVPDSFAQGIITLIYKKKGEKDKIENYKPISLLNVDYNILSKIISNRLKEVVGSIISSSQAYGIPGRDIADTIGTVRDMVEIMNTGWHFSGHRYGKRF